MPWSFLNFENNILLQLLDWNKEEKSKLNQSKQYRHEDRSCKFKQRTFYSTLECIAKDHGLQIWKESLNFLYLNIEFVPCNAINHIWYLFFNTMGSVICVGKRSDKHLTKIYNVWKQGQILCRCRCKKVRKHVSFKHIKDIQSKHGQNLFVTFLLHHHCQTYTYDMYAQWKEI